MKYLKLVAISVRQSNSPETAFAGTSKGGEKSSADEENMESVVSASLVPLLGKRLSSFRGQTRGIT